MGADSASSGDNELMVIQSSKIAKIGPYLIGGCGSGRALNLVQYKAKLPKNPPTKNLEKFLVNNVIPAIQESFKDEPKCDGELVMDFGFLIGVKGQLYVIQQDFTVDRSIDGYYAEGSGKLPALGVLYATRTMKDARKRVVQALTAASKFTPYCRAPFTVQTV